MVPNQKIVFALALAIPLFFGCHPVHSMDTGRSAILLEGGELALGSDPVFASTVALFRPSDDPSTTRPFCAGTVIAQRWVVTAAHCREKSGAKIVFRLGAAAGQVSSVMGRFTVHPAFDAPYNEWNHFDIALVKLDQDAPGNATPVPLADASFLKKGQKILLAGYGVGNGQRSPAGSRAPFPLHKAPLTILNVAPMNDIEAQGILEFTSENGNTHASSGDSGAPLYVLNSRGLSLLGIVIGGYEEQGEQSPKGYATNPIYWRNWIEETARKQ